jgi:hypothetical protein
MYLATLMNIKELDSLISNMRDTLNTLFVLFLNEIGKKLLSFIIKKGRKELSNDVIVMFCIFVISLSMISSKLHRR